MCKAMATQTGEAGVAQTQEGGARFEHVTVLVAHRAMAIEQTSADIQHAIEDGVRACARQAAADAGVDEMLAPDAAARLHYFQTLPRERAPIDSESTSAARGDEAPPRTTTAPTVLHDASALRQGCSGRYFGVRRRRCCNNS